MMNLNENEKAMLFLDSFVGLDAEKKLKILSYYSPTLLANEAFKAFYFDN